MTSIELRYLDGETVGERVYVEYYEATFRFQINNSVDEETIKCKLQKEYEVQECVRNCKTFRIKIRSMQSLSVGQLSKLLPFDIAMAAKDSEIIYGSR